MPLRSVGVCGVHDLRVRRGEDLDRPVTVGRGGDDPARPARLVHGQRVPRGPLDAPRGARPSDRPHGPPGRRFPQPSLSSAMKNAAAAPVFGSTSRKAGCRCLRSWTTSVSGPCFFQPTAARYSKRIPPAFGIGLSRATHTPSPPGIGITPRRTDTFFLPGRGAYCSPRFASALRGSPPHPAPPPVGPASSWAITSEPGAHQTPLCGSTPSAATTPASPCVSPAAPPVVTGDSSPAARSYTYTSNPRT